MKRLGKSRLTSECAARAARRCMSDGDARVRGDKGLSVLGMAVTGDGEGTIGVGTVMVGGRGIAVLRGASVGRRSL